MSYRFLIVYVLSFIDGPSAISTCIRTGWIQQTMSRLLIAAPIASLGLYATRTRILCDALGAPTTTPPLTKRSVTASATRSSPLIDPHQFATGSVIGIASGILFKRIGKLFLLIVGGTYLLLRVLLPPLSNS